MKKRIDGVVYSTEKAVLVSRHLYKGHDRDFDECLYYMPGVRSPRYFLMGRGSFGTPYCPITPSVCPISSDDAEAVLGMEYLDSDVTWFEALGLGRSSRLSA